MSYICIIYVLDLYYIWKNHANAGFCLLLFVFLASAAILVWLLLAFVGFFGVRGDPCMAFVGFFGVRVELWLKQVSYRIPVPMLYISLWLKKTVFC